MSVIQVKCNSTAFLQSFDRHCTYSPPNSTIYTSNHQQQGSIQTYKTVTIAVHRVKYTVHISYALISSAFQYNLGKAFFRTPGIYRRMWRVCFYRVWRTFQSKSPGDTNIDQKNLVQERRPDTYSLAKLNAWYRGVCNRNLQDGIRPHLYIYIYIYIYIFIYLFIYLLTVIGLSPGGSTHLHTKIHRPTQITEQHK